MPHVFCRDGPAWRQIKMDDTCCLKCERPSWTCECIQPAFYKAKVSHVTHSHWLAAKAFGKWAVTVNNHTVDGDPEDHTIIFATHQEAEIARSALDAAFFE